MNAFRPSATPNRVARRSLGARSLELMGSEASAASHVPASRWGSDGVSCSIPANALRCFPGSPVPLPLSFAAGEQGISLGILKVHDAFVHSARTVSSRHLAVAQPNVLSAFKIHQITPSRYQTRSAPALPTKRGLYADAHESRPSVWSGLLLA